MSPGPLSNPTSGLFGANEMDFGAEMELAEGPSSDSGLCHGEGPPPPASSNQEDLAVCVRMAKACQMELELPMKDLLEQKARNDATLFPGRGRDAPAPPD